ncbi:LysR family transcriptional regulator [Pseudonocardia spinosispora]|uniref:LysR family transcriptional regulator n=1 Tax=Pseudonocardia spinosispora TaxID=103441 RepID=UPI002480458D|nr:LysR family transcriptional regulator [Pseudonocardia spinosispora]
MSHLRYFVAVAEELNFTRAAERLRMATSPLSQRIKGLEREVGTALFERTSRKVTLTEAGERLLPEARDVIRRFDALVTVTGAPRSTATVGIAPDVSAALRTRFLNAVADAHPELRVTLRPASSEPLLRALRAGDVDLAIVHGPVDGRRQVHLETLDVVAVLGAGTGFDGRTSVRLTELAHLPYASIGYDAAPELYRRTDEILNRHGIRGRLVVEDHNLAGLAHVVASGQAFALVSKGTGATGRAFTGEPVVLLDVEDARLRISTVAVWNDDDPDSTGPAAALAEIAATLAS